MIVIPLVKDGAALGAMSLYRQEVRPFSEKHHVLMEGFATQAVIALENARLFEESRRHAAELEESNRQTEQLLGELHAVLDTIDYGVVFMDRDLRGRVVNRAFREMWGIPEAFIATRPTMAELINYNRHNQIYKVPEAEFDAFVEARVAAIRAGDIAPMELRAGRRAHPAVSGRGSARWRAAADLFRHHRRETARGRTARDPRPADRDDRGVAGHQQFAGRSRAGLRSDRREGDADLRCRVRRHRHLAERQFRGRLAAQSAARGQGFRRAQRGLPRSARVALPAWPGRPAIFIFPICAFPNYTGKTIR